MLISNMNISNNGYTDNEKQRISEALNFFFFNPSQTIEIKTVHVTAIQKARKLVESHRRVREFSIFA